MIYKHKRAKAIGSRAEVVTNGIIHVSPYYNYFISWQFLNNHSAITRHAECNNLYIAPNKLSNHIATGYKNDYYAK